MMFNIPEEILLAVKKGSNELDKRYPGWREGVYLEYLDMASCDSCLLAHVAGWRGLGMEMGYYTMLNEMVGDTEHDRLMADAGVSSSRQTEWAIEHGFMEDDTIDDTTSRWRLMEEAWKDMISPSE